MSIPSVSSTVSSLFGWHNDQVNSLATVETDLDTLVTVYQADAANIAALASELLTYDLPQPGYSLGGENYSTPAVLSDAPVSPLPVAPEGQAIAVSLAALLVPVFEALLGTDSAPIVTALENVGNGAAPLA